MVRGDTRQKKDSLCSCPTKGQTALPSEGGKVTGPGDHDSNTQFPRSLYVLRMVLGWPSKGILICSVEELNMKVSLIHFAV